MPGEATLTRAAESAGFRGARGLSLRGIVLTAAAHAAVLPIALSFGQQVIAAPEERLLLVDLALPATPPPPPPASEQPAVPPTPPVPFALAHAPQAVPSVAALAAPVASAPAPAAPGPRAVTAGPAAAPAAPATIAADGLDTSLIEGEPPRYPRESRRKKEQGTAVLLVIVGIEGRVEAISIARSSGSSRLDQAALKAVRGWRWQPLRRDGQPVKVRGLVEIPFVLTSGRKSPPHADCNSADPRCRSADGAPPTDRGGRMDRRHGDLGDAGPDGEA